MTDQNSFLIEIGTEELPPKSLRRLADAFAKHLAEQLLAAQLIETQQQAQWFAAPRRLAVRIDRLAIAQQPRMVERRGPALTAAWDGDGNPTKATLGFCRSCGVEPTALETMRTDKGEWLVYRALQEGATAAELLPAMVASSLQRLPIDRRMRWGSGDGAGASARACSARPRRVLNAIATIVMRGIVDARRAEEALDDLPHWPIERIRHEDLVQTAWTYRHNISAYDAVYVAAAALVDAPVLTANGPLARAPSLGVVIQNVRM